MRAETKGDGLFLIFVIGDVLGDGAAENVEVNLRMGEATRFGEAGRDFGAQPNALVSRNARLRVTPKRH